MPTQASSHAQAALSVSELNRQARQLLEQQLGQLWVSGELSNFSRPASGHWYFTLKDSQAQVRCAMFRGRNMLLRQTPKAGDQVIVRGKISLYEARGDYQLIAEHMSLAGEGLLQQQFEQLKNKLNNEGLFASEWKKPLPQAKRIAIISSATGAAVHDILHVLQRRDPSLEVVLIPAQVQGAEAPSDLLAALKQAQQLPEIDAIIIGRGGGSLEDLWAFNDENLARAIFACPTPVISAVGHEIDFSVCDFVADVRAPTPSAAAELISRDRSYDKQQLNQLGARLHRAWQRYASARTRQLHERRAQLKHPGDQLQQWAQRCDSAEQSLKTHIRRLTEQKRSELKHCRTRLNNQSPAQELTQKRLNSTALSERLKRALLLKLKQSKYQFEACASELDLVSPLATIKRGYSISRQADGSIVRSVQQVSAGDTLCVQLADGQVETRAIKTNTEKLSTL
ncbi:exodeoxyribonuclease VII large subunit [Agaribacterium haliotis]|uniref:exodeoxyribonuclease VII large subunit n=1 Tax=Agaribacterium haliotis TaxID=2013869 RepID=UPI000BB58206|nr:exodeoxyribonuclease VII large subunit [Agaribacterium haliotis]